MKDILPHLIPVILVPLLAQLLLHELGHLIGGKLTGWKLLYLQIFHTALVKGKKGFRLKKVKTLNFQCAMYPASIDNGAFIYNIGGCFLNFIMALTGLITMVITMDNLIMWMYSWSFFVFGIGFLLMNGIPNTKRFCNDMACLKLLKENRNNLLCHNAQFLIAKDLFHGKTYSQISKQLVFKSIKKANNDLLAYQTILEYYYHLELGNYDLIQKILQKMDPSYPFSREISDILYMERFYMDMLIKIRKNDSRSLEQEKYWKDISTFITMHETKGDLHSIRIKVTYEVYQRFLEKEPIKALATIEVAKSTIRRMKVVYQGEKQFCINQLDRLKVYFV